MVAASRKRNAPHHELARCFGCLAYFFNGLLVF